MTVTITVKQDGVNPFTITSNSSSIIKIFFLFNTTRKIAIATITSINQILSSKNKIIIIFKYILAIEHIFNFWSENQPEEQIVEKKPINHNYK